MSRARERQEAVAELTRLALRVTLHVIKHCTSGDERTRILLMLSKEFHAAKRLIERSP